MRSFKSSTLILLTIIIFSCTPTDENPTNGNVRTIGKIDSKGNYSLTTESQLKSSIANEYKIETIDYVKVYTNSNNITVLEVGGPIDGGKKYVTVGKALLVENGNILLSSNACSQSCTSVAPCEGCSLTILGDCSGSCSCSSGFGGSCTHTVSTKEL